MGCFGRKSAITCQNISFLEVFWQKIVDKLPKCILGDLGGFCIFVEYETKNRIIDNGGVAALQRGGFGQGGD